ncbi:TIGR03943 family protein [Micromonospora sp. KC213]|uniref:TIGR03943 family putative permease subunit n=1 Tax=Micromonospora sp. KC213 TaxID=2530378 RepID=UPI001FB57372|nr:TIGR03943 family protein [Micromonospora sp. KC213]
MRYDLDLADTRATVSDGESSVGHQHGGEHNPTIAWLLVLPVLALTLLAPPALGAYRAEQTGTVLHSSPEVSIRALPAEDPVTLTLYESAHRASMDAGTSLVGRRVRLTGFVATGPDGRLLLARIVVSCCAADGRPIKVGLTGKAPAGLVPDTWIEVTGRRSTRIGTDPTNEGLIPYLHVDGWQPVPSPRQPYERGITAGPCRRGRPHGITGGKAGWLSLDRPRRTYRCTWTARRARRPAGAHVKTVAGVVSESVRRRVR